MISASALSQFEARVESFPAGITGEVGVRVFDSDGNEIRPRTTLGVTESPAGSGSYIVTLVAPAGPGEYSVFWDWGDGVTLIPSHTAAEELQVGPQSPSSPAITLLPVPDQRVTIPHFALPFRLIGDHAVVNEQGSAEEIADAAGAVLSFPVGSRLELPDFGLRDQTFREGGPSTTEISGALARWEPRASDATVTASRDSVDIQVDDVTVTVHAEGGA